MARTPNQQVPRRSSRPARAAAPVRFETEDEEIYDEVQSAEEDGQFQEFEGDVTGILKEHQARQAKKAFARTTAYQVQKKAIYAAARKNAQEISRSGVMYIESATIVIQQLKTQEISHEKALGDFQHMCEVQEEMIDSLLSVYPPLFNELARRRSEQVAAANEKLRKYPVRRQLVLKKFSKNARAHVEEARENERIATDALTMIKHYKSLLNG